MAYPPEMLTESSYLILPFAEGKPDSFAININGTDAVLIKKINNNFKTFITSTKYAHKVIEKDAKYFLNNENLLEIETHFQEEVGNDSNLIDEDITFSKGDTLLDFLYVPGSKRKEISSAIKSFSSQFDPAKIKLGTKGKIIRTNEGKILGFYLMKSKHKSVLTYLSAAGYETITASSRKVDDIIYKNLETTFQKD